jgi:DNA gyrase subunit A
MGRSATGVHGIRLNEGDEVVSMAAIRHSDANVIVVGTKGYGKRSRLEDFRQTNRGAKGVISMNLTEKTGDVSAILEVTDNEDIVVMTAKGVVIRQAARDIRVIGRNTQGVRLIKLDEDDSIADIAIVVHEEEVEDDGTEIIAEGAEDLAIADVANLEGHTTNGHAAASDNEPSGEQQEDLF